MLYEGSSPVPISFVSWVTNYEQYKITFLFFLFLFIYFYYYYFLHDPTNAQLFDDELYCSYMFQHYCVIFSELVVSTSYISMSMQSW